MAVARIYSDKEIKALSVQLQTGRYGVLLYLAHQHESQAYATGSRDDAYTASFLYQRAADLLASIAPKTPVNTPPSVETPAPAPVTVEAPEIARSARTIPCDRCGTKGRVYRHRHDRLGGRCLRCDGTGWITPEQQRRIIGFDVEARMLQLNRRRSVLEWFYRDDPRLADFHARPADWTDRFAHEDEIDDTIDDKIAHALDYYASDDRVNSDDPVVKAVQAIQTAFADGVFYSLDEGFVKHSTMGAKTL